MQSMASPQGASTGARTHSPRPSQIWHSPQEAPTSALQVPSTHSEHPQQSLASKHWASIAPHSVSPVVPGPVASEVEVSVVDVPAVLVVVALSDALAPVDVDVEDAATVSLLPLEAPEVVSETAPLPEPLSASSPASSSHLGLRSWQAQARSAVTPKSERTKERSISVHGTTYGQLPGWRQIFVGILAGR